MLLCAPAFASACSGATTKTYSGAAAGDWATSTNWTPTGVPGTSDVVCIPAGASVAVTTTETVADLEVDPHNGGTAAGSVAINGGALTLGPGSGSTLSGPVTFNGGTLELNVNTTVDQDGSLDVSSATVTIDGSRQLKLNGGADVTVSAGSGTIQNNGTLLIGSSTGANPTNIAAAINGDGAFSNQNGGPVNLTGGASGAGSWTLGSGTGADEPVVTLDGGFNYGIDQLSDTVSGGAGHLVIANATYTTIAANATLRVHELDMNLASSTMDFSTSSPTSIVDVGNLYVNDGFFEVDAPLTATALYQHTGTMLCNGTWNVGFFHWGGGQIQSASAGNGTVTADTLDLTLDGLLDTGTRSTVNANLTVTGSGTQDYPYSGGTFDIGLGSTFEVASGAKFVIGADLDIGPTTNAGNLIVNGTLAKTAASGTTTIYPHLSHPSGLIEVDSGTLSLAFAPLEYSGNTLSGGGWQIAGIVEWDTVDVHTLSASVALVGSGHFFDPGSGQDGMRNLVTNNGFFEVAGTFSPPAGAFTNNGTLSLASGATMNVTGGDYQQTDPGGLTEVKSGAHLNVAAGNKVLISAGTLMGSGTIGAPVQNDAFLEPGASPGTLTINGDYTQTASGVLEEEIGGTGAGQFDKLVVTGKATLAGTLNVTNYGGFVPSAGQTFDAITGGTRAGTFTTFTQPSTGALYELNYGTNPALRIVANGVSIADAQAVAEGNSGTTNATFTVSLAQATAATVSVHWATQDGTATAADGDYQSASGDLTFTPGQTTQTVSVAVNGDTKVEPDETFQVNLSNVAGSRIARGTATGTILNDDQPVAVTSVAPGDIDGFLVAPPPVQGKAVNIEPVSGTILVKLPNATKFVKLPDREQVPVGSTVDARKGVVRLFSAGAGGQVQSAIFYQGVFVVTQKPGQALTTLKLAGGNFKSCPKAGKAGLASDARKKKPKVVRQLWGQGSGKFRTTGRFASATIRGTKWLTVDRCDGTLVRVTKGSVAVLDIPKHKSIVVKAPKSYLALAPKRKH